MSFIEQPLLFACEGETLLGVLSVPDATPARPTHDTGVLIVVGGPQVRVGSHRQFTQLARHLAAAGYPVLRFDVRGMGDSGGEPRSFEELGDDIAAAIGALMQHRPTLRRVVLWGLCDGASASLLYLHARSDTRVAGVCLVNPWVRSEQSLAVTRVKHYYLRRLAQRDFWRKLFSGGVAVQALSGLLENLRLARNGVNGAGGSSVSFQHRMALAWAGFDGHLLLLLSGNDYTAKEFIEHSQADALWRSNLAHPRLKRIDLAGADHTFSSADDRRCVENATLDWLLTISAPLAAEPVSTSPAPSAPSHSAEHA